MAAVARTLGVFLAVAGLVGSGSAAVAAPVTTMIWVPSFADCDGLVGVDCVAAVDGSALEVEDPLVTASNLPDYVPLPSDHGAFGGLWAGAGDELLFPQSGEQLGPGDCATDTLDAQDLVAVGQDVARVDAVDEHLDHKSNVNFDGSAGFFSPGLGACDQVDSSSDLVVALDGPQFDPPPNANPNRNRNCGRRAKVTRGKQSVDVTVTDRCASCAFGDIKLSPAAFDRIAVPSEGRVPVTWDFID